MGTGGDDGGKGLYIPKVVVVSMGMLPGGWVVSDGIDWLGLIGGSGGFLKCLSFYSKRHLISTQYLLIYRGVFAGVQSNPRRMVA